MVMKPRGGGANPNRPQRTIIGRVYERFKPISEWKQEDDYDSLLIYLPGFQREFIKITIVYPKKLRVRGERLVAGNKWNRFQEDFEVSKNCKMSGIRAKLDGGILTITTPRTRKIIDAPITTANATTTAATSTRKSKEPMKGAKQYHTDSAKPSSFSTLDATDQTLRPQPLAANPGGLQPSLDRAKSTEEINNKVEEYERVVKGLAMGGMKKVVVNMGAVVVLVVALGVYVSYVINGSSSSRVYNDIYV